MDCLRGIGRRGLGGYWRRSTVCRHGPLWSLSYTLSVVWFCFTRAHSQLFWPRRLDFAGSGKCKKSFLPIGARMDALPAHCVGHTGGSDCFTSSDYRRFFRIPPSLAIGLFAAHARGTHFRKRRRANLHATRQLGLDAGRDGIGLKLQILWQFSGGIRHCRDRRHGHYHFIGRHRFPSYLGLEQIAHRHAGRLVLGGRRGFL